MRVIILTMINSGSKLALTSYLLLMFDVIVGALLYNSEVGEWDEDDELYINSSGDETSFPTVFRGVWLLAATTTTVGYGGISPITVRGTCIRACAGPVARQRRSVRLVRLVVSFRF